MGKNIKSLHDLFVHELRDLLYAEKRLTKALPKMARAADNTQLRGAFESHLKETHGHVKRLERIFEMLGERPEAERCDAIDGLIEEADGVLAAVKEPAVKDAALIAQAQRVEHYEIAAYGCVREFANWLGLNQAVGLLEKTLSEEGAADQALTAVAMKDVNEAAAVSGKGNGAKGASMNGKSAVQTRVKRKVGMHAR